MATPSLLYIHSKEHIQADERYYLWCSHTNKKYYYLPSSIDVVIEQNKYIL